MKNRYSKAEKEFLKKIGIHIKNKRWDNEISQEELAYRAKLDRTYVSNVEKGKRNVSIITLKKIAEALRFDIIDLFKNGK